MNNNNNEDGFLFSEETMESLKELGEVLERIHNRLISEGYTIEDGKVTPPEDTNRIQS